MILLTAVKIRVINLKIELGSVIMIKIVIRKIVQTGLVMDIVMKANGGFI